MKAKQFQASCVVLSRLLLAGLVLMIVAGLAGAESHLAKPVNFVEAVDGEPRMSVWQVLDRFSRAECDNGTIALDLPRATAPKVRADADDVEALWISGAYAEALTALRKLEESGVTVAVGVSWATPIPPGSAGRGQDIDRGVDLRIGSPRVGCDDVSIDDAMYILPTALKKYGVTVWHDSGGGGDGWSVNFSDDDGATWAETYYYVSAQPIQTIDSHYESGDLWVAYVRSDVANEPRVRRFHGVDGTPDSDYGLGGVAYPYDSTPHSVSEVGIAYYLHVFPSAEVLHFYSIQSDNQLRHFYQDTSSETPFEEYPTGITNAASGLAVGDTHFQSYIGTDNHVYVRRSGGALTDLGLFTGTHPITSIGGDFPINPPGNEDKYGICAVEHGVPSNDQGIKVWITRDSGVSWAPSVVALPELGEGHCFLPSVAINEHGYGLIYQQETGSFDTVWFRQLLGLGLDHDWNAPVAINDASVMTGMPMALTASARYPDLELYAYDALYITRNSFTFEKYPMYCDPPGPGGYCHSFGAGGGVYISNVSVGAINKSSGYVSPGYSEYTNQTTQMQTENGYALTVTTGAGGPTDMCNVWVDWNENQVFDGGSEIILVTGDPGPGPYTATITPPAGTPLGEKRMRIVVVRDAEPQPCEQQGGYNSGAEIEDYIIQVVDYCDASGSCGPYIDHVIFRGYDAISGCDGYNLWPVLLGSMTNGHWYDITISVVNGDANTLGGLWFDWNRDGDFTDAGEEIALSWSPGPGPYSAGFAPPMSVEDGLVRMRVRLHQDTAGTNPCGVEAQGEVEDYLVSLEGSPYCLAVSECDSYISRVQLGDIDRTSGCDVGYDDYTQWATDLVIGTETPITITVGNDAGYEHGMAWIDWNQNDVFEHPGEQIPLTGSPGSGPYTGIVVPPLDAVMGVYTTMRVRVSGDEVPYGPCDTMEFGETEDYSVKVVSSGYCLGTGGCTEHIGRVQLGDIDNASACSQGYANYTHLSTDMMHDVPYELTVTAGLSYPSDTCAVWIDWNHDGDFDEPDETVPITGSPGLGPYTATIVPRPEVIAGEARLRIRLDYAGPLGPCDTAAEGEVEDYTINVLGYCDVTGDCNRQITRVQLGDIDNSSSCDEGYADYTALGTGLTIGQSEPMTITYAGTQADDYSGLWIDWDRDFTFDYPRDHVAGAEVSSGLWTLDVTPPADAQPGLTRLRISMAHDDFPFPCGALGSAEVEDYSVVLISDRCPEDLVDPRGVEQQDLNAVLNRWGDPECLPAGAFFPCPEDLAAPEGVEQQDLNAVLNRWGDPECE